MNYSVQIISEGSMVWGWLFLTELESRVLVESLSVPCLMCHDGKVCSEMTSVVEGILADVQHDPVKYGLGPMNPGGLNDVLVFLGQFLEKTLTYPDAIVKIEIV